MAVDLAAAALIIFVTGMIAGLSLGCYLIDNGKTIYTRKDGK